MCSKFDFVAETGGRYKTASAYIQDDIKVTPKFTLNLGLRMEGCPAHVAHGSRFDVVGQFASDVAGAVDAEQPRPVMDMGLVAA